MLEAI